jgi:desulfoferrodoxin (superoxide reductase-like protein)
MNAAEAHWTEWIFVVSADDGRTVVAGVQLASTDSEAVVAFNTDPTATVIPFAYCSKHGLWQGTAA